MFWVGGNDGNFLFFLFLTYISYQSYAYYYFNSTKFFSIKNSVKSHVKNCNDLNEHIEELKKSYVNIKSIDYDDINLADKSIYNMKRRMWSAAVKNHMTHNCSLSVLRNARDQPIKYLFKYFDLRHDNYTLETVENMLNNFSAVEQGKKLLMSDRESIVQKIIKNIPSIIIVFSKKRFEKNIGFDRVDLSNIYMPVYSFVYVSSGGNSSAKADFIFNVENLNKIVSYLGSLIKFRASVYGQRLLMTSHLRERIKRRDSYTCKTCGISTSDEKNLLLEIDHKIPLSKGGITSEENLQTLCWKCNRSKGAKILTKIS